MVLQNLIQGILYGFIGQIISYIQLQGGIKLGLTDKYGWAMMLLGIPISWAFMKSVQNFILAFNGETWPSRLMGFGIGVIVFTILSWFLFKEAMTVKTLICLFLAVCIILVQILWK